MIGGPSSSSAPYFLVGNFGGVGLQHFQIDQGMLLLYSLTNIGTPERQTYWARDYYSIELSNVAATSSCNDLIVFITSLKMMHGTKTCIQIASTLSTNIISIRN